MDYRQRQKLKLEELRRRAVANKKGETKEFVPKPKQNSFHFIYFKNFGLVKVK